MLIQFNSRSSEEESGNLFPQKLPLKFLVKSSGPERLLGCVSAIESDGLNSIPRSCMIEGEKDSFMPTSALNMLTMAHIINTPLCHNK